MAEQLEGSLTITLLDTSSTMYFIKGNNPLTIRLVPGLGCYLYASTDEILEIALNKLGIVQIPQTEIPIHQGDIMTINAKGRRSISTFDDIKLRPQSFYSYWDWCCPTKSNDLDDYLDTVLDYGRRHGIPERELKLLLDAGYSAFDLEELIYDDQMRASCIQDIMADFGVC